VRELALHVLDLLQNAREAGATSVELRVEEDGAADRLTIEVADNGRGMEEETVRRITDPFFTTRKTRHVGLGLPLLASAAERCSGSLAVESAPGRGTRVTASFRLGHIDRAPLGDLPSTLLCFLLGEPYCDLMYTHRRDATECSLDTRRVREAIGPVPIGHPAVRDWLIHTLTQGEECLAFSAKTGSQNVRRSKEDRTCRSSGISKN
jgi:anti-sigma regulatory factor (Ser/Thr protein kinase)